MRIISGRYRGKPIKVAPKLKLRPTTDRAKESLFHILNAHFELGEVQVLDLFSGTGNISYEFASRGASQVISIEKNAQCRRFIRQTTAQLQLPIHTLREDAFRFLRQTRQTFDFIFADPPYTLSQQAYEEIHRIVFERKTLNPQGWLILEHSSRQYFKEAKGFLETRNYGGVHFSFFSHHAENRQTAEKHAPDG